MTEGGVARFAMFVDGSNLYGSLHEMQLDVDDYEAFFRLVFARASDDWARSFASAADAKARLLRVYWYVVGRMDEWDLSAAHAQASLRDAFESNPSLHRGYLADAGRRLSDRDPSATPSRDELLREAWVECFHEIEEWYEAKVKALEGMRRFQHAIRSRTDFVDVIDCGHWRLDMLGRSASEKGLDAALAVDMATQASQYDVALVFSGDADMLPSMRFVKGVGKSVGAVEFVSGYPPEERGRGFSSRLRMEADFVTRIYEMDLVTASVAVRRATRSAPSP